MTSLFADSIIFEQIARASVTFVIIFPSVIIIGDTNPVYKAA